MLFTRTQILFLMGFGLSEISAWVSCLRSEAFFDVLHWNLLFISMCSNDVCGSCSVVIWIVFW